MSIQSDYKNIDFSRFSKVKDTLLHRLHQERRTSSGKVELSMDDLDYVAAAGTNTPPQIGTGKKSTTE